MSKFWPKGGLPGILHHYTETLTAFEFTSSANTRKPHSLLFVGGLGDGLATTSYLSSLTTALAPTPWSVFTLNLSSSYTAWGTGHLDRDTDEIATCLSYILSVKKDQFPGEKVKLALMGHSTGSQDVLHYLYRPNPHTTKHNFDKELVHVERPVLDGAIMQAAVSDREVVQLLLQMKEGWKGKTPAELRKTYDALVSMSHEAEATGRDTLLPLWATNQIYPDGTPITARRFLSLVSPSSPDQPSEDDLFSSDIPPEKLAETFGKVKERGLLKGKLCLLQSGADQSVPEWVDKEALLARFRAAIGEDKFDDEHSGIIKGASHALSNDDQGPCREDLCRRVLGYLGEIEKA